MSARSRNSHRLMPATAKDIIEKMIRHDAYTAQSIANRIGVSHQTISRIRKGTTPSRKTELGLIRLYCSILCKQAQDTVVNK